jgi:hypothetical protein
MKSPPSSSSSFSVDKMNRSNQITSNQPARAPELLLSFSQPLSNLITLGKPPLENSFKSYSSRKNHRTHKTPASEFPLQIITIIIIKETKSI